MGVGRIFSRRGALKDFSKIFLGGAKVMKFVFFSKLRKQTFLLKMSKSKGGLAPALSTPVHQRWLRIQNAGVDSGRILRFYFGPGARVKIL